MPKFKKGQSGNPAGRPKSGSNDNSVKALLHSHAPALVKKAIALALRGDPTALKMCLDRVVPKVQPVSALPPLPLIEAWHQPNVEVTKRYVDVMNGMLTGQISGKQAEEFLTALATGSENLTERCTRFGGRSQTRGEMLDQITGLVRAYANTEQLQEIIQLLQADLANPNSRAKKWDTAPQEPELASPPKPQQGQSYTSQRLQQPQAIVGQVTSLQQAASLCG